MDKVRAGDRERFGELYQRVAPSIYAWAALRLRGAVGRYLQPDDLVQEVWLRALGAFSGYDPAAAPLLRWIFGIVHNVLRETLSAMNRRARAQGGGPGDGAAVFDPAGLPAEITSLTQRMARDQAIQAFMERVKALDSPERDLVSLRGLEGLSFKDVARFLRVSESTARKRWERLRARLTEAGPPDGIFGDSA